jgi:hypothetical protein
LFTKVNKSSGSRLAAREDAGSKISIYDREEQERLFDLYKPDEVGA